MKFHSLGQYFYKLYAMIFVLLLIPLTLFIFLYQGLLHGFLVTIETDFSNDFILYTAIGIACIDWAVALLLFTQSIKPVRKLQSLGEKLSRYAPLTLIRNILFCTGMVVLAPGYYLTESNWITIVFFGSLILPAYFWPFPKRVCKELKLKGDEEMMVLYKMDSF